MNKNLFLIKTLFFIYSCNSVPNREFFKFALPGEIPIIIRDQKMHQIHFLNFLSDGQVIDSEGRLCNHLSFLHAFPSEITAYTEFNFTCHMQWVNKSDKDEYLLLVKSFQKMSTFKVVFYKQNNFNYISLILVERRNFINLLKETREANMDYLIVTNGANHLLFPR